MTARNGVRAGWMTCGWCESGHHERCRRYIREGHETLGDVLCLCAENHHAEQGRLS